MRLLHMSEYSGLGLVTNPMTRNHKNEPKLSHDVIDEKQKTAFWIIDTKMIWQNVYIYLIEVV